MRKFMTVALLFAVALMFAACGGSPKSSVVDQARAAGGTAEKDQEKESTQQGKALVAYFSHSGNTQTIANLIHQSVGGDLFRIETVTPYPEDYKQCTELAKEEQIKNFRPKLVRGVENMDRYDTIFIGYPNWWGTMPMAVFTFLEEQNLSGKRIIPFCTNEGSGMGRSAADLANTCPNSTIVQGLAIRGGSVKSESTEKDVAQWLRGVMR